MLVCFRFLLLLDVFEITDVATRTILQLLDRKFLGLRREQSLDHLLVLFLHMTIPGQRFALFEANHLNAPKKNRNIDRFPCNRTQCTYAKFRRSTMNSIAVATP